MRSWRISRVDRVRIAAEWRADDGDAITIAEWETNN